MKYKTEPFITDFLLSPRMRIYRHLLLQLVVFLITINVFWDTPDEILFTPARFYSWLGYFAVINLIIYTNAYLLAPRFLLKNRLYLYLASVLTLTLLFIVSIGLLQSLFDDTRFEEHPASPLQITLNIVSSILSSGMLVAGSSALILFKHWIGYNQRVGELEAATLQSELKFLKNQINPHFLFNMLNSVYVLIKKERDEAAGILYKLEDLLRYQLNDSSQETIQLRADIHFLNDFLKLEKLRRDNFHYQITREGNLDEVRLPPLLFIPFVENAVKHNTDSEQASFVHLAFKACDHRLFFQCINSKPAVGEDKENYTGGLGLKNIRRRLELLYPGCHSLEILENKQSYTVNLHLNL